MTMRVVKFPRCGAKRKITWSQYKSQYRDATAMLYIPNALNIDLILWQTQLIVCAVKC